MPLALCNRRWYSRISCSITSWSSHNGFGSSSLFNGLEARLLEELELALKIGLNVGFRIFTRGGMPIHLIFHYMTLSLLNVTVLLLKLLSTQEQMRGLNCQKLASEERRSSSTPQSPSCLDPTATDQRRT